jgi:biopolymer transport protein ExbB
MNVPCQTIKAKTNLPMSLSSTFLRSQRALILLGILLLVALAAPDLLAQEDGDAGGETKSLMDKILDAGMFMAPIGILSVLMITLAVFNTLQLSKKKFSPPGLRDEILANMAEVRVRSSIDIAAQDPSYLGRLVATTYPLVDATDPETLGRTKVEDMIADFSIRENARYMSWIGYFAVIAQAAPMIGLFGTVAGMIMAFDTMGLSGGADPSQLAGNISLALMTTAGGLVVAIPSIFCFYIFKNRFNKLVSEVQETAAEGLDLAVATVNADQQLAKVPEGISEG